jgi:HEAT repeat protein
MGSSRDSNRIVRWVLTVVLLAVGLTVTWAWGQAAHLAAPPQAEARAEAATWYAAWQPAGAGKNSLFRSSDAGATWQALSLPQDTSPLIWADDGHQRVAVVSDDGWLFHSRDEGETWMAVTKHHQILSMVWDDAGNLFLGTDGQGVYRLTAGGSLDSLSFDRADLASESVIGMALAEGRLFAATPTTVFYTDDSNRSAADASATWILSSPAPDWLTTIAAAEPDLVYVGTATSGIYRSTDSGQSWLPMREGLGLAAGQMVNITALRVDPQEPGVLYAAVDHVLGGAFVHSSAAGIFVTLDYAASWQALAGPGFPEAQHASALTVFGGNPLDAQAVTAMGLQSYTPDVVGALAALASEDPQVRAGAARLLGVGRVQEASSPLIAALDDPEPSVVLAAGDALGRINDPSTVSGLLVAVEHPSQQVRLGAARALGRMGVEAAVDPLRSMLLSGSGLEVNVAGEALGRIGSPAAVDALLAALVDTEPTPRWHAAMANLETLGQAAVGPLMAMLESNDPQARQNAAQALGWIGSPAATRALIAALKDKDASVRGIAAWALGEIGHPQARVALERVQLRDPEHTVQQEAAWALTRLGEQADTAARWPLAWAPLLVRFQAMRWLILALSLGGAAWLTAGKRPGVPTFLHPRMR